MKTLIIGGGASGLTAAICAATKGDSVTVLEASKRVCKKLLMTGGGRCNLFNADKNPYCYNNSDFVKRCFEVVSEKKFNDFLSDCGIFVSQPDLEGRVYPITFSANSVCDCLRLKAERLGVDFVCETKAQKIFVQNDFYFIETTEKKLFKADRVIVAAGSTAQAPQTLLDCLVGQEYLTPILPALTPLGVSNPAKSLSGIRHRGCVSLIADGKSVATQSGEIQFREFGLSGICVFNISSIIARNLVKHISVKKYDLSVDLLPDFSNDTLCQILDKRQKEGYTCDGIFVGLLPNKIGQAVVKNATAFDSKSLAYSAKNLQFFNAQLADFSLSQVCAGGVDTAFLDDKLKLPNGVAICGEAINIDGLCGGYNLYFAFVSGILVGNDLSIAKG